MKTSSITKLRELSSRLPKKISTLKMLILFGSRARGDTHASSDWDFAVLYDGCQGDYYNFFLKFPLALSEIFSLNSEQIDVVELTQCSPLVAHFIARDGELIYEREPGEFEQFKQQALMSEEELQAFEKSLHEQIEQFLKGWPVK